MAKTDPDPAFDAFVQRVVDASNRKIELDKRLADVEPMLVRMIEAADGPAIDVQRALLDVETVEIEEQLEALRLLVVELQGFLKDKGRLASRKLMLHPVAKEISNLRGALARDAKRCDQLLEDADAALKKSFETEEAAQRSLVQLQRWQRLAEASLATTLASARSLVGLAHEAVLARDAQALAQRRAEYDRLPYRIQRDALSQCSARLVRWRSATLGKGLGDAVDRGLLDEIGQLEEKLKTFEADLLALERLTAALAKLQIPAFDAKKAAQVLGLGSEQAARLGKALGASTTDTIERALDAFLKQRKAGLAGKAGLALLRKAKLI